MQTNPTNTATSPQIGLETQKDKFYKDRPDNRLYTLRIFKTGKIVHVTRERAFDIIVKEQGDCVYE